MERAARRRPHRPFHVGDHRRGIRRGVRGHPSGSGRYPVHHFRQEPRRRRDVAREHYPDLRVDVPNHFYSYSFAPNPDWSDYYSRRDELQAYVERCADEFGVRPHLQLEPRCWPPTTTTRAARWRAPRRPTDPSAWSRCNVVISAVGMLNRPSIPAARGARVVRGAVVPLVALAPRPRRAGIARRRHRYRRQCHSVRPGDRGRCRAVSRVPAFAALADAQPRYHREVTDEERWLLRNVPYYEGWYRFLMFWNSSDRMYPAFRVDPEWSTPTSPISGPNEKLRVLMTTHVSSSATTEIVGRDAPRLPAAR